METITIHIVPTDWTAVKIRLNHSSLKWPEHQWLQGQRETPHILESWKGGLGLPLKDRNSEEQEPSNSSWLPLQPLLHSTHLPPYHSAPLTPYLSCSCGLCVFAHDVPPAQNALSFYLIQGTSMHLSKPISVVPFLVNTSLPFLDRSRCPPNSPWCTPQLSKHVFHVSCAGWDSDEAESLPIKLFTHSPRSFAFFVDWLNAEAL